MLFDSLEYPTPPTSGQGRAPASRSRTRARGAEFSTLDIFGQHGSHSSESAALQSSLENRLRAAMASSGSTLFRLTWNDAVTPSGRRICALRALALRTSDSGCTSWPTPLATDGSKASLYSNRNGDPTQPCLKLTGAAKMAAWSTPITSNANGAREADGKRGIGLNSEATLTFWPTPVARDHKTGGMDSQLSTVAPLAAWATPAAHEAGGTPETFMARKTKCAERAADRGVSMGVSLTSLAMQVQLADSGTQPTGSSAETPPEASRSPGQLNPEHSRWLQGYPAAWGFCGATATRSSRKSPPSSSMRRSKP